ncbi:NADH-quinone oxidoreductase subunit A [Chlorobium phaeobacteroides]|jgi:NADH-quinone oxidoreductase subunit A|uniref:NADH-quinone oxidoreductase subunit A n=1 Tax=Chlorobium phaeobacteroides (strain DSM 266 / SMG 266 / 2430) TaxID=290317 RepID=NUOA_CHLPD|nr:NADH-quinone oxidoreductase subunit A [Chlorobium phaeobacteroides]A1BF32.1 RecName: Full=NADH-quinone oxidoreductase subunit A; AltName: Full=NADH dehydrogenase I subunit A; AltName: Full=NDH-1 subunit A; AltName: Full=NUO1 [Chlorobium phaeobacteroides DSM 266]ABL65009.1 NADH dehydrogenase subunit A [Chlorobium phaeobacteroides DSM 266]MBV5326916.1 NADH-quinone oxidoreductase subunit A [Chlorobium sp.]
MDQTLSSFGNVFAFLALGIVFVAGGYLTARMLRPSRPNPAKNSTYECGEEAVGSAWVKFNIRFYVVALIFIIFDVEVVFLYPWATVFKSLGVFALVEVLVFAGILILGLVYAWVKGDLDWVRPEPKVPQMPVMPDRKAEGGRA